MKKVRLGILGIGNMGSGHIQNIQKGLCPEIQLSAVADWDLSRIQWAEENIDSAVLKFASAEEMMDSGTIDAILIAVPHYDHPKYTISALRKGIHVMCEKPAGVYTEQVLEMNREAEMHSDLIFGMMFNQRTNCIYRKMRELVQSGKYGQIRRTSWIITNWYRPQAYYDSGNWRATWSGEGGGVLLNQCPHNLDLWQWICGMPVKVECHMKFGKWHDIEVEDDVTAYVEYANGATGTFITSTGDTPGTNRFEITMDGAKLTAEDGKLRVWELEQTEPEFSRQNIKAFGTPAYTLIEPETDGKNPQHAGVLNAFAAAILRGEPLVADGKEGIFGLTLSNAMHLSQWLNRPIDLPLDPVLFHSELMKRVAISRRKIAKKNIQVGDFSSSFGGDKK